MTTIEKLDLNMLSIMMTGSHQIKSWQADHIQSISILLKLEVDSYSSEPTSSQEVDAKTLSTVTANGYRKGMRYFWDGGLMTNTPLMQLVLLHRQYWWRVRGLIDSVPRLGICVINLHPKKQTEIPTDRDGVINRNNDITFSDRTNQEEAILLLISDFVDLTRELLKVAEENGVDKNFLANLLNRKTNFHGEYIQAKTIPRHT